MLNKYPVLSAVNSHTSINKACIWLIKKLWFDGGLRNGADKQLIDYLSWFDDI